MKARVNFMGKLHGLELMKVEGTAGTFLVRESQLPSAAPPWRWRARSVSFQKCTIRHTDGLTRLWPLLLSSVSDP